MICQAGCHRRRYPQRAVDAREVVVHVVQRHGRRVVQLLAEGVRQPRERRIDIRMVKFWRSMYDVKMCFGSGLPVITSENTAAHGRRAVAAIAFRIDAVDLLKHRAVDLRAEASSTAVR